MASVWIVWERYVPLEAGIQYFESDVNCISVDKAEIAAIFLIHYHLIEYFRLYPEISSKPSELVLIEANRKVMIQEADPEAGIEARFVCQPYQYEVLQPSAENKLFVYFEKIGQIFSEYSEKKSFPNWNAILWDDEKCNYPPPCG